MVSGSVQPPRAVSMGQVRAHRGNARTHRRLRRPHRNRGALQSRISSTSANGEYADGHESDQVVEIAGMTTRTRPSALAIDDSDDSTRQARNSNNNSGHPPTPSRVAHNMAPCHMASTMRADHLAGAEPRTVSRCKTPPHESPNQQPHGCPTITHAQPPSQFYFRPGTDRGLSPFSLPADARD